jgi:hypothetical protein
MSRTGIELHDSELSAVNIQDGQILLEFRPAYVHESSGTPGVDPGRGGWQDVDVVVRRPTDLGRFVNLPIDVSGGSLTVESERWSNVVPLPLDRNGTVVFELLLASGETLTLHGGGISVSAVGEANFCEVFKGM